ncbi:hypothetical protein BCV69DRAFT_23578 [Microstroma glucosiphilum]|uniref:Uncharacterized protein n=1 Tax=Pseudomicrostroma glucosiphilum TaxID=1684307 RepID=A0A316UG91_9BASI|nr:hypothetical protein BCV69DRAFT_23578 [Pseudomicrostroma glucosiphilum]PWN24220.1 hypothetical protein BCV69DRAFT_23578 [Pseudomicrostroma glucosiphilum]
MAAALDQSDPAKQKSHNEGEEQEQQPIDIRARVAAFEKRSDTAAAPPLPPPRKAFYVKPESSTAQSGTSSIPPPPVSISHGSPARPSVTTQDIISRVNTTPRSRGDLTPGTTSSSPSLRSAPSFPGTTTGGSDSPSEFGVLSPLSSRSLGSRLTGAASSSSSSLPLPPSNGRSLGTSPNVALSPFSAAYKGGSGGLAPTAGPSSSHSSQFDALAEAGSVKRVGSGTSLNDLTTSSIARARERGSGVAGVSGKVPLPPSGVPGGSMTNGSSSSLGVFMPSDMTGSSSGAGSAGGRASPALPPRSGLASTRGLHKRSSGSLSQISDAHSATVPAYAMRRNRSTTESPLPSPSVRSLNPLDDDDNDVAGREKVEGGYGLILHPTLKPTTSPVASRPASRASNSRSVPSSPQVGPPEAADLLSVQNRVRVGVQPPTPSPEKNQEGTFSMAKAPYMSLYEPRRNHSIDSTASSEEKEASDGRSQYHRGQAPSLPPRGGAAMHSSSSLPYVPYKQRGGSGSGLMLSSSSAGGVVASKVPPPPSMPSTSLPSSSQAPAIPPRQPSTAGPRHSTGHSPAASVSSSPTQSPKLAAASKFAQRSSRSGGPGYEAVSRSANAGPSGSGMGLAAIQPPPSRSRLRSSSEGPLGEMRAQHPHDGRAYAHTQGATNGEAYAAASSAPIVRDTFHGTLAYRSSQASLYGKRAAAAAGGSARFKPARSLAPADEAARKRYEDVWDREVQRMERKQQRKNGKKEVESGSSGVDIESTIRKPLDLRYPAVRANPRYSSASPLPPPALVSPHIV